MSVMHHVPGRLRIRLSGMKGNPSKAHSIERNLSVITGVIQAESNPRTGCVIIRYDPRSTNLHAVIASLNLPHVRPASALRKARERSRVQKRISEKVASAVLSMFVEKALERSIPLLLAALL